MWSSLVLTLLAVADVTLGSVVRTSSFAGHALVVKRDVALEAEEHFQTQVLLQYRGVRKCGTSILDADWVMTGAQCVGAYTKEDLSIRAGSNPGSVHQVDTVLMHPDFSYLTGLHDIALLQISPPLSMNMSLRPATLPEQNHTVPMETKAKFLTWLNTKSGLKMTLIDVDTMDQQQCVNNYSEFFYHVHDSQMCITVPGSQEGDCYDMAGSALFIHGMLVGLSSWSETCTVSDTPSVFTRISSHRTWIREQTGV